MNFEAIDPELLRSRDTKAWDALYTATCRRTYRVLYHVTGANTSVLEELNQQVWLSAMESIGRFDASRGTAQDWILGIARFKGLTYLRVQYSSRVVCVGKVDELTDFQNGLEDSLERAEYLAMIRATIASLPENWQYVLRMKYEEKMSVNEIADFIGNTPKGVESVLSRARKRLRELMRDTLERECEP